MHILRNDEAQIWELQPTTAKEGEVLTSILSFLKRGQRMNFHGARRGAGDRPIAIRFNAGGKSVSITRHYHNGGSMTYTKYTGGVTWWLKVDEEELDELWRMRDTCYCGSSGLIFLEPQKHELGYSLVFTGMYCKLCGAPMIQRSRCEWSTCTACVEQCDHEWERGAMWGAGVDIGVGEFCGKCGIGNPADTDYEKKTAFEHALGAEQELGVIVYNKHFGMTATQLKQRLDHARKWRWVNWRWWVWVLRGRPKKATANAQA